MQRYFFLVILSLAACEAADVDLPAANPPAAGPNVPAAGPATSLPPADCPPGEWCWMKGRPLVVDGDRHRRTVFAMGPEGEFLRWVGDRWARQPLPVRRAVRSGWVFGAEDAWASDDGGQVWHYDGTAWTNSSPTLPVSKLIGARDGSLWAVAGAVGGAHGQDSKAHLLRRDASAWSEPAPPYDFCLGGVYAVLSADEVWTAGLTCDGERIVDTVEVRRWNGSAWELVGEPIEMQGWFPSFEIVGDRVRIRASGLFEWDGTQWSAIDLPSYPQDLDHQEQAFWDGFGFTRMHRSLGCSGVYRLDERHIWCFGNGQIHTQIEDEWVSTIGNAYENTAPNDAWSTMPPTVWAGGATRLATGLEPDDVFRVRRDAAAHLEHFDGLRWTTRLETRVLHMHGSTETNVWFATADGPYHYDGQNLVPRPVPTELTTDPVTFVHAMGAGSAFAISEHTLLYFDGQWTTARNTDDLGSWIFQSVAGETPDQLWLARFRIGRPFAFAVDRFDGDTWHLEDRPVTNSAAVTTIDGRPWLHADGTLQSLVTDAPAIALPYDLADAVFWIGSGSVWVTTAEQAVRRLMP